MGYGEMQDLVAREVRASFVRDLAGHGIEYATCRTNWFGRCVLVYKDLSEQEIRAIGRAARDHALPGVTVTVDYLEANSRTILIEKEEP